MPKTDNQPTSPAATRRALLGASAVALAVSTIGTATAAPHPDAALIEACAAHIVNLHAFNASDDVNGLDFAASPLWVAYTRTRDFIDEAVPQSMEGVLAKASAARAEATQCEGAEVWENAPAGPWAAQVVNDLLRLARRA